jgi:hypothetical protein
MNTQYFSSVKIIYFKDILMFFAKYFMERKIICTFAHI